MIIGTLEVQMMANIARLQQDMNSATQLVGGSVTNIERSVARAEQSFNSLGSSIAGVRSALMSLIGVAGITEIAKAAIDARVQIDKLNASLKFSNSGDAKAAARDLEFLKDTSEKLGLEFASTAKSFAGIAAASKGTAMEGQKTKDVFLAVSKASTVMGLSADETAGALRAISQMMSKGKVQAEELRGQLGERLPSAFQTAADAMGVTTAKLNKMLELGQVISEDFLPRFAAQLEKNMAGATEEAAKGTQGALNRLSNAFTEIKWEISPRVASSIDALADNLSALVKGGLVLAASGVAILTGRMIAGIAASVASAAADKARAASLAIVTASEARSAMAANMSAIADLDRAVAATAAAKLEVTADRERIASVALVIRSEIELEKIRLGAQINDVGRAARLKELAALSQQLAATERALAATGGNLTAVREAQTVATNAAAAAAAKLNAANAAAAAANAAAAAGTGILARGVAALGGPLGVIITLLAAGASAWYMWGKSADEATNKAKTGTGNIVEDLRSQTAEIVRRNKAISEAGGNAEIADALAAVSAEYENQIKIKEEFLRQSERYVKAGQNEMGIEFVGMATEADKKAESLRLEIEKTRTALGMLPDGLREAGAAYQDFVNNTDFDDDVTSLQRNLSVVGVAYANAFKAATGAKDELENKKNAQEIYLRHVAKLYAEHSGKVEEMSLKYQTQIVSSLKEEFSLREKLGIITSQKQSEEMALEYIKQANKQHDLALEAQEKEISKQVAKGEINEAAQTSMLRHLEKIHNLNRQETEMFAAQQIAKEAIARWTKTEGRAIEDNLRLSKQALDNARAIGITDSAYIDVLQEKADISAEINRTAKDQFQLQTQIDALHKRAISGSGIAAESEKILTEELKRQKELSADILADITRRHKITQQIAIFERDILTPQRQALEMQNVRLESANAFGVLTAEEYRKALLATENEKIRLDYAAREYQIRKSIANTATSNEEKKQLSDALARLEIEKKGAYEIAAIRSASTSQLSQDMKQVTGDFRTSFVDAFASGSVDPIRNFAQNLKTTVKRRLIEAIYDAMIQKYVVNVFANVLGVAGAAAGSLSGGAGGTASGILGLIGNGVSAISTAAKLFGTSGAAMATNVSSFISAFGAKAFGTTYAPSAVTTVIPSIAGSAPTVVGGASGVGAGAAGTSAGASVAAYAWPLAIIAGMIMSNSAYNQGYRPNNNAFGGDNLFGNIGKTGFDVLSGQPLLEKVFGDRIANILTGGALLGKISAKLFGGAGFEKAGGSAVSGVDVAGNLISNTGFSRDQFWPIGPSQADAQMKILADSLSGQFGQSLIQLGGKAIGSTIFQTGFDTDPKGTAENRITGVVADALGNVIYKQQREIGRDNANIEKEMTLEVQRMIVAGLMAADLPGELTAVLKHGLPDLTKATQEAIETAMTDAQFWKATFIDGMESARTAFGEVVTLEKFIKLQLAGESLTDTFSRIAPTFDATNQVAKILGRDINAAFGAVGLASQAARQQLVDFAGGADNLTSGLSDYYMNFYSESERAAKSQQSLGQAFADNNLQMPSTREGFRQLVEAQDLTTEAGRRAFASLMALEPAFAALVQGAEDIAKAVSEASATQASLYEKYADGSLSMAKATADITAQFDKYGVAVPKSKSELAELIKSIDTTTASGRGAVEVLNTLSPAFDLIFGQSGKLADAAGLGGDAIKTAFVNAINSANTPNDPEAAGRSIANSVVGGIYAAMQSKLGDQVQSIITQGVVDPIMKALINGATLSQAVSAVSFGATLTAAKKAISAMAELLNSPEWKSFIDQFSTMLAGAAQAGQGVGKFTPTPEQTVLTQEAAKPDTSLIDYITQLKRSLADLTAPNDYARGINGINNEYEDGLKKLKDMIGGDKMSAGMAEAIARGSEAGMLLLETKNKKLDQLRESQNDKIASYDIKFLQSQGRTYEAIQRQREIELKNIRKTDGDYAASIQSQVNAAQDATATQNLQIALMNATGNAAGALGITRYNELRGLNAVDRALKEQIYAAEDLASATQRASDGLSAFKDYLTAIGDTAGANRLAMSIARGDQSTADSRLNAAFGGIDVGAWLAANGATLHDVAATYWNALLPAQQQAVTDAIRARTTMATLNKQIYDDQVKIASDALAALKGLLSAQGRNQTALNLGVMIAQGDYGQSLDKAGKTFGFAPGGMQDWLKATGQSLEQAGVNYWQAMSEEQKAAVTAAINAKTQLIGAWQDGYDAQLKVVTDLKSAIDSVNALSSSLADNIATIQIDQGGMKKADYLAALVADDKAKLGALVAANAPTADQVAAATKLQTDIMANYAEQQAALQKTADFVQKLSDYANQLMVGDLSPLSSPDKMAEAQRQYNETLAAARAGDEKAREAFTGKADTLLKMQKDASVSRQDYSADVYKVQRDLKSLGANSLTDAQRQTALLGDMSTNANKTIMQLQDLKTLTDGMSKTLNQQMQDAVKSLADIASHLKEQGVDLQTTFANLPTDIANALKSYMGGVPAASPSVGSNLAGALVANIGSDTSIGPGSASFAAIQAAAANGVTSAQLATAWSSAHPENPITGTDLKAYAQSLGIPMLADGGIVRGPTFALLGEGGRHEMVTPLPNGYSSGGGNSVDIQPLLGRIDALTKEVEKLTAAANRTADSAKNAADSLDGIVNGQYTIVTEAA